MKGFDTVWDYLQTNLKPGTEVKNWTVLRGYFGDDFPIESLQENALEVYIPSTGNIRRIPRKDFEKV